MKQLLFTLVLTAIYSFSFSQSGQVLWQKAYGGSEYDGAYKVKQTADGGYITCGYSYSGDFDVHDHFGATWYSDAWFVRLDANGDTLWTKSFGGTFDEYAVDVVELDNGDFVGLAVNQGSSSGDISSPLGGNDFWLIRMDANGTLIWEKSIGGSGSETPYALTRTQDNKLLVAGYTYSTDGDVTNSIGGTDAWIAKVDLSGNVIWDQSYGGTDTDELLNMRETADSGFILVGRTWSGDVMFTANQGLRDIFLIKVDSLGAVEWAETYGGSGYDNGYDVVETNDGSFVVTGGENSTDGDFTTNVGGYDFFMLKVNSAGVLQWANSYGGTGEDYAFSLTETSSNNYTATGYTISSDGDVSTAYASEDVWVINVDQSGGLNWETTLGGDTIDIGFHIIQVNDGGYVMAGLSSSGEYDVSGVNGTLGFEDFWIVKLACTPPIQQEICMVTVDSTSTKNIVVWEKPVTTLIDSFYIYRDIVGTYTQVGSVAYADVSQFIDSTNGINPNITSYRYKVSAVDTCGNEGPMSNFHETIHLTTSVGGNNEMNLVWDNYEGFAYSYYRIWRDGQGNGSWVVIDSVSNTNNTYTDLTPPSLNARYMIEVLPPAPCTANRAINHNSTRSNRGAIAGADISEKSIGFELFPNPAKSQVQIQMNVSIEDYTIRILDMSGREVQKMNGNRSAMVLNIEDLENGMYIVQIMNEEMKINKQFIKR